MVNFLRALALCLCSILVCAGSDFADSLYKAGLKAEHAGDLLHAYLLYARASALEPANVSLRGKEDRTPPGSHALHAGGSGSRSRGIRPGAETDTLSARDSDSTRNFFRLRNSSLRTAAKPST